jgi:predicted ATPase
VLLRMISSLHVEGYRGFQYFDMSDLGRVNLLVGNNSSGKTSLLEALNLIASRGAPSTLAGILTRRGEQTGRESLSGAVETDFDVSHLFVRHEIHVGSKLTISVVDRGTAQSVTLAVVMDPQGTLDLADEDTAEPTPPRLVLQISSTPGSPIAIPMIGGGGIRSRALEFPTPARRSGDVVPAQFITTESLRSQDLVTLWDNVALTPNEELALQALRFVDPNVERIAAQAGRLRYAARSRVGFIVKLRHQDMPIPIGSMGDGIWRMLAMAIAVTQCAGGLLLIDEIDTGLHYSVMADMWRLIFRTARQLNVQVFATTHSFDCIQSLANLCVDETDASDHVTLQRIEPGKHRAVPYSESEIKVAAERGIEVR